MNPSLVGDVWPEPTRPSRAVAIRHRRDAAPAPAFMLPPLSSKEADMIRSTSVMVQSWVDNYSLFTEVRITREQIDLFILMDATALHCACHEMVKD
jgi:hypothetical protein